MKKYLIAFAVAIGTLASIPANATEITIYGSKPQYKDNAGIKPDVAIVGADISYQPETNQDVTFTGSYGFMYGNRTISAYGKPITSEVYANDLSGSIDYRLTTYKDVSFKLLGGVGVSDFTEAVSVGNVRLSASDQGVYTMFGVKFEYPVDVVGSLYFSSVAYNGQWDKARETNSTANTFGLKVKLKENIKLIVSDTVSNSGTNTVSVGVIFKL